MDFFKQKDGFPFNGMPQPEYSPEKIYEMKKMVKQYQSVLNDDFWGDIHGLGTNKKKKVQMIPYEIWENDQNYYLSVICPGLQDRNHAKIFFHNDQVLTLKIKHHSIKPIGAVALVSSDLPQKPYEREIFLQKSVVTSDYSSTYENGILTYTFKKVNDEFEIPFDF
ncbi:hypothetical protein [Aquibacillus halophilus]|nr:hypothetical protein [Aquibacillus halophilus]